MTKPSVDRESTSEVRNAIRRDGYLIALACFALSLASGPLHWTVAPVVFAIVAVVGLARASLAALLVLSMPAYALLGVLISNALIESGWYIKEQFRNGYNIGSTGAFCNFLILFLIVGHVAVVVGANRAQVSIGRIVRLEGPMRRMLVLGLIAVSGILLAIVLTFGTATGDGGDRFLYWDGLPGPLRLAVVGVKTYLIPAGAAVVGFYLATYQRGRLVVAASLALPYIALFLMGEKMSAFATGLASILFGVGLSALVRGARLTLRPKVLLLIAAIVMLIAVTTAVGFDRGTDESVIAVVVERLVLQGHVWYGVYDIGAGQPILTVWNVMSPGSSYAPSGLNLLSYLVTDPSYVANRLKFGVTFTMGGPPEFLAVFGLTLGTLLFALSGATYALVARLAARSIEHSDIASVFLSLMLIPLLTNVVLMGFWDDVYNPVAIGIYFWFAIIYLVRRLRARARRDPRSPIKRAA